MFKNKKLFIITLVLTLFIFTGCSNKMQVKDFFEKSKEASDKIQSFILDTETKNEIDGKIKSQIIHAELLNNANTKKIKKGKGSVKYKGAREKGEVDCDIVFVGDAKNTLITTFKENGKNKETKKENSKYRVTPDYYELMDGIYTLKEKDLILEEENDEYHLKLRSENKNFKVFDILKSQYGLDLGNVYEDEVDVKFKAVFDKKTFYLKSIVWSIEYNGNKGAFKLENTTTYSDWDNVNLDKK